jgi:methyl-accepting chemotaxis protein
MVFLNNPDNQKKGSPQTMKSRSIGTKMFLIGLVSIIGISALGLNSYITNTRIESASQTAGVHATQVFLIREIQAAALALRLAVMEVIEEQESGMVNDANKKTITECAEIVRSNFPSLANLVDSEEDRQAVKKLASDFDPWISKIQVELVKLIDNRALNAEERSKKLDLLDENLDKTADGLEEELDRLSASAVKKKEAADKELSEILSVSSILNLTVFAVILSICLPTIILVSRSIVRPVRRTIDNLSEGSEQVASAAEQVSSSSQALAAGASEQAASIEETTSSLEEMASLNKQNAANAQQANIIMGEATQVVAKANDSMQRLTVSMSEISKASEETSKIVKTIDEIAFQTNLLALNAAVEAARAGEAGAGFAVVADEVRNLAMRAAEAAKTTANLIEETVKKVKDGSKVVAQANAAFQQVAGSASKAADLVAEISVASKEQAQGIAQINAAVAEMDKVIQQNAANAEESASASEELSAQAGQMQGMVVELATIVNGCAAGGQKPESGDCRRVEISASRRSPAAA